MKKINKKSQKFEKQIERIYHLLKSNDTIVKWDDKIIDPDNPTQLRQIDITIKYKNFLTFVECRFHKKVQDVKWIEELYGRKVSLNADAIIAVSFSGFTVGAIKKAKKLGVILRDTKYLTEEEIKLWGYPTKVKLVYFNYENVLIKFLIKSINEKVLSKKSLLSAMKEKYIITLIFEKAAQEIEKENIPNIPVRVTVPFVIEKLFINNFEIKQIVLESDFRMIEEPINTPSVVVFDDPSIKSIDRNISIEKFDLDKFEITKTSNNVSVVMDLSKIKNPINSQFRNVKFELNKTMYLHNIEIIAKPNFKLKLEDIILETNYYN